MQKNFASALERVLTHEGGFSNDPADPGGATNRGITQATYDAWRGRMGQARRPVRQISQTEVEAIYRRQYWDAIRGDDLPAGLDYAVFDYAVNSGSAQAGRDLQRVVGVGVDGQIGEQTIAASRRVALDTAIVTLCERRLSMLRGLKTWGRYGKGWSRRVAEVQAAAREMARGVDPVREAQPAPGKGDVDDRTASSLLAEVAKDPVAAVTGVAAAAGALGSDWGPIQIALAVAIVAGVAWALVRALRRQPA